MTIHTFLASIRRAASHGFELSLPTVRTMKGLSAQQWLGVCGHIIAGVIAVTSTVGLFNFASGLLAESLLSWLMLLPVTVFFGVLLQIVVVSGIKLLVQSWRERPGKALLCASIVLVTWCMTIGASYGSYWNWISRDSYEQRATERSVTAAAQPLEDVSAKFSAATAAFSQVSSQASLMAGVESKNGTSCGYLAGVGEGQRWRLRDKQNKEAAALSSQLLTLNVALQASLGKLGVRDEAAIAAAYREARATTTNPVVGSAASWVATQRAGFAKGFTDGAVTFTCGDAMMTALLDTASSSLSSLPQIAASPPRVVRISDGEGMLLSFVRLFGFGSDNLAQDSDFMPILIPALIEVIMTALIVLGELDRPLRSRYSSVDSVRPVDHRLRALAEQIAPNSGAIGLYEQFSNHLVELDGAPSVCFAVPTLPGPDRDRARTMLLLCQAYGRQLHSRIDVLKPYCPGLPFARLPQLCTASWNWRDHFCDIHVVPRELIDAFRLRLSEQAEAQLFAT